MASDAAGRPLLAGFWSGGFEGADHVNVHGVPLDMLQASGHWHQLEEDHARAAGAGLGSVRESIGWRLAENSAGVIDLSRARRIAESADRHGLQVLWTLMHYGVPDGLSLHDDALIDRFSRFAAQVVRAVATRREGAPVFTPINEIGFLAWAASQPHLLGAGNGTVGLDDAGVRNRGYAVKCRLVVACLRAMRAMRAEDPRCRFMHAEPLVHVVAPHDRPELAGLAQRVGDWQWQVWDLLLGIERPELGGHPDSVDLMGVNHYHNSQWELDTFRTLQWHLDDPRRRPLSALLTQAWKRYGKPLVLAETSHVGSGREAWLHDMAGEVRAARAAAVPVEGFCLYPLVDRPDWNDSAHWHRSGLWHVADHEAGLPRAPVDGLASALKDWQQHLPKAAAGELPWLVVLCHRRWGAASHRTQQLVQQLASRWRVLWVDPPRAGPGPASVQLRCVGPGIEVLIAHGDRNTTGWTGEPQPGLLRAIEARLATGGGGESTVWLTAPRALFLARALSPRCLVIDTGGGSGADGLAAPWEARDLLQADLVFAEGEASARSLQAATGIRVLPICNGVDLQHFTGSAPSGPLAPQNFVAMEAQSLQGPASAFRVGFAGAIDARLDTDLIAGMADARPGWHFVMVGPVVGRDAGLLPQRPNIAWLGEQPHEVMPALMRGWQVGWLPWHAGAATVDAHPTQVLEYLASGLPVVSPWLCDLVACVPAGIHWACSPAMHLSHFDALLAQPAAQRCSQREPVRRWLQQHRWSESARRAERWMCAHAEPLWPVVIPNDSPPVERQGNVVHKVA